jgi:hypothetical protein
MAVGRGATGAVDSLWETDGGHTGAIEAEPEECERRAVEFFDRNLLEG